MLLLTLFRVVYWLPTRKKLLYYYTVVANPARGLLNREREQKNNSGSIPPPPTMLVRSKNKIKNRATHDIVQALSRSRSVSRPYKDSFGSSTRSKGVASQNSTLPCAITSFPVSLLHSFAGDV